MQKAAADPGSEGPQSKRSLTNIHRYVLLIGRHPQRPSAPASLDPVTVRTFLVYPFPSRFPYLHRTPPAPSPYSSHSFLYPSASPCVWQLLSLH
jgi:hypothetical protein